MAKVKIRKNTSDLVDTDLLIFILLSHSVFLAVPDVPTNEATNSSDLQESINYLDK